MSGSDAAELPALRELAGNISLHDRAVAQFVSEAFRTIEVLSTELAARSKDVPASAGGGFLDSGHRDRLDLLIIAQQAELDGLNAVMDRVQALLDFSAWSADEDGQGDDPVVRWTDLRRALPQAADRPAYDAMS